MLKLGYDSSNAYDITPVINGAYIAAACAVMVVTGMGIGWIKDTLNYASAGKVACAKQFQKEYFDRCNPRWDGVACTLEAVLTLRLPCWPSARVRFDWPA